MPAPIFMEAQEAIGYATDSQGKTFQYELISEGEVTLNAKHGMVGTKEFPMLENRRENSISVQNLCSR